MFNFMKKDFKIVQRFSSLILISLLIIGAGFLHIMGRGLNLGLDYVGGATVVVELNGDYADRDDFKKDFQDHFTAYINENGYQVADNMQVSPLPGGGATYEFRLAYMLNGQRLGTSEEGQEMFIESLNGATDNKEDKGFSGDIEKEVKAFFESKNMAASFEEGCVKATVIGPSSTSSLLRATYLALALALVAILVYIMIRFTVSSGLAAIVGIIHDVAIMVALTTIFQIPVNTTFIAAVITIIGYSINSSIVIFDKVRECRKSAAFAYATDEEIANYAIKHSLVKIALSIITTLIMVVVLLVFSVSTIREFILPIIFGLLAGTFSALCLNPSIWVLFRKIGAKAKSKKA